MNRSLAASLALNGVLGVGVVVAGLAALGLERDSRGPPVSSPERLPATGQTECYGRVEGEGWVVVPCEGAAIAGQDGAYRAGCPMAGRFVDHGDGTVTDTCTGLMWQKDTADVNGDGAIGDDEGGGDCVSWQDALAYCEGLSRASGTWADMEKPGAGSVDDAPAHCMTSMHLFSEPGGQDQISKWQEDQRRRIDDCINAPTHTCTCRDLLLLIGEFIHHHQDCCAPAHRNARTGRSYPDSILHKVFVVPCLLHFLSDVIAPSGPSIDCARERTQRIVDAFRGQIEKKCCGVEEIPICEQHPVIPSWTTTR